MITHIIPNPAEIKANEVTNDDIRAYVRGMVTESNAQVVGAAIYNGGSLSGLISLRSTHKNPKRLEDYKGVACKKGHAKAGWSGKWYYIALNDPHANGIGYRSVESLRAAIDKIFQ